MASHNTIEGLAGHRWSTYQSHLMPAMKRHNNLHVLTKSSVTKLVWKRKKVIGIQYLDNDGRIKHVKANREVLLSAGTIKTTQILQLSGVGPPHVLEPLDVRNKFQNIKILNQLINFFSLRYPLKLIYRWVKIFRIIFKSLFSSNSIPLLA